MIAGRAKDGYTRECVCVYMMSAYCRGARMRVVERV